MKKFLVLLVTACLLFNVPPVSILGASPEFTDSIKDQLTLAVEMEGATRRNAVIRSYNSLSAVQKELKSWDSKNTSARNNNDARLSTVKKQITNLDATKIALLEQKLSTVKQKYQPLFDSTTLLNKQVGSAKKLKDKTLTKLLQAQADTLKTAGTLARQEIRTREAELKEAKAAKKQKSAEIRKILGEIDTWKAKIKTEKSSISAANKSAATEWSNFKAALKKKDIDRIAGALTRLDTLFAQGLRARKNINSYEVKITAVLARAEGKLK